MLPYGSEVSDMVEIAAPPGALFPVLTLLVEKNDNAWILIECEI